MKTIADRYLPFPRILHPWPEKRFLVTIQGGEQLMATRHDGIDGQGKWLAQVLRGWMAYYAVLMSGSAI